MTCPHCGADASAGQKFCPKCSRLVDSPLLKIKQQIDAARAEIRNDLNAARVSVSLPSQAAQAPPQYRVTVDTVYAPPPPPPPSPYKYAPHHFQTPALTRPPSEVPRETILRSQERHQKNQRKKKQRDESITRAQHTDATHRFDPLAAAKKAAQEAKAAAALGPIPERFSRPASLTMFALLDLIGAVAMIYIAMQLTMRHPEPRAPIIEFSRIAAGATAFLFVVTAFGMLKLHPYGRFFQRLFLAPVMFWFPIGTIYGIASWLYLGSKTTRLYFSGRSPRSLNATELASWRTSDKAAPVFAFLIFAFGFIPGIAYAAFISGTLPMAFQIAERTFPEALNPLTQPPSLESGAAGGAAPVEAPAPSASSTDGAPEGDSAGIAVVQIKQMQRAQAAYASLNEGYYDRLECVLTPAMCIRNGDERNKAVLLDASFIPPRRHGYTFLLNTSGEPAVRSATASPTSMRGFSYRAIPSADSGDRIAYCGDETGMICAFDARTADGGNFGRCPVVCRPIE